MIIWERTDTKGIYVGRVTPVESVSGLGLLVLYRGDTVVNQVHVPLDESRFGPDPDSLRSWNKILTKWADAADKKAADESHAQ